VPAFAQRHGAARRCGGAREPKQPATGRTGLCRAGSNAP
jgi:hypothetical protein